jgi:hypothetical protein
MRRADVREHEMLGELYVYEVRRTDAPARAGIDAPPAALRSK